MRWISSAGGPLVLIPKVLQPRWQGTFGVPSDYEMACSVEGYTGIIEKAGYQILVLGDEPLQTAVSRLNGRPCLVRWAYAPSPGVAESSVTALERLHLRGPLEAVAIHIDSSSLALMDAGASGEHPGDILELELELGTYRVLMYEFAPARDMKFLVHAFEPHTGGSQRGGWGWGTGRSSGRLEVPELGSRHRGMSNFALQPRCRSATR